MTDDGEKHYHWTNLEFQNSLVICKVQEIYFIGKHIFEDFIPCYHIRTNKNLRFCLFYLFLLPENPLTVTCYCIKGKFFLSKNPWFVKSKNGFFQTWQDSGNLFPIFDNFQVNTTLSLFFVPLYVAGYWHQASLHQNRHTTRWRRDSRKISIHKGAISNHVHQQTLDHSAGNDKYLLSINLLYSDHANWNQSKFPSDCSLLFSWHLTHYS